MTERAAVHENEPRFGYLAVFVVLIVFTALEVGTTYVTGLPEAIKLGLLVIYAVAKVGLVLLFFMQLKYEARIYAMPITFAAVLVVPALLVIGLTTQGTSGTSQPVSAQAAQSSGGTSMNVSLKTYSITPDSSSGSAGSFQFHVVNDASTMPHEFIVVKTDVDPSKLPLDQQGNVDLTQLDVLARSKVLSPGESQAVSVTLASGSYVFLCNLPGHYQQGMYTTFSVSGSLPSGVTASAPIGSATPSPTATATPAPSESASAPAQSAPQAAQATASPQQITVVETNYQISFPSDTIEAGKVTFHVENQAQALPHAFVVIKTDISAANLPKDSSGNVDESKLDVVGKLANINAGSAQDLTVDLTPGHYAVICDLPGHFQQGMYADLTVTPSATATTSGATTPTVSSISPTPTAAAGVAATTSLSIPQGNGITLNFSIDHLTIIVLPGGVINGLMLPSTPQALSIIPSPTPTNTGIATTTVQPTPISTQLVSPTEGTPTMTPTATATPQPILPTSTLSETATPIANVVTPVGTFYLSTAAPTPIGNVVTPVGTFYHEQTGGSN